MAHEISHVQNRHIIQGFISSIFTFAGAEMIFGGSAKTDLARYLFDMSFTKRQEAEADYYGLRRLQKAHISNLGLRDFFARNNKSNLTKFLSDHPNNGDRVAMIEHFGNLDTKPVLNDEKWQALKELSNCQNF